MELVDVTQNHDDIEMRTSKPLHKKGLAAFM